MLVKFPCHFIAAAACLLFLLLIGCQKEQKETPQTGQKKDSASVMKNESKSDILKKHAEPLPDITGTWTGKLQYHNSVLKITEQDSFDFKGNITTNFREVINQQVSGKFDPARKTLTMKDLVRNRYWGTYSAKLTDDLKSFAGTFTGNVDQTKWIFNYKKK